MTRKDTNEWKVKIGPPAPLELTSGKTMRATVTSSGCVRMIEGGIYLGAIHTSDIRSLIASLQSILVLAEEHFGADWGKGD